MAFTYETRKKITDEWIARVKKRGEHLAKAQKELLPDRRYYYVPEEPRRRMEQLLKDGTYCNLSSLYREEYPALVNVCVPTELQEEFYYALDQMNQFQMTAGWYRRSLRSESYQPFVGQSVRLLQAYSRLDFYGCTLSDLLTGNTTPEFYDHARNEIFAYAGILAAKIDKGETAAVEAVKDILLGEGNTMMLSHELIRGIVMGRSEELYEVLGKFLLAARLQEGARQAVCETMDEGRPEAFLHLFSVIEENNLVRYSSIKRAVSTWIGIFDERSVDRITEKLVRLMGRCLREPAFCEEQLATNDSVAISCALWAKGFYSAGDAIAAEQELIRHGTKNQKMTASYFNRSLQMADLKMQAAKDVILHFSEDMELVACFLPGFMDSTGLKFTELVRGEGDRYYSLRDDQVNRPRGMKPEEMFESREEAAQIFSLLREILARIPKKGVVLDPCIFPWYKVTMTQSDIASRMCLIAWMLGDEETLDEAAELIPLTGQGGYSVASRASIVRVLLYRPTSARRKKVLFDLLHNAEEYTCKSAHALVNDMELAPEDYRKIEQNLKYKKGRSGTLSLLKKQGRAELVACIGRLLAMTSEECHMGALDLAMQIKKEDGKVSEELRPLLLAFENPTGKEQVLLDELVGAGSGAQDILNTPGFGLYDTSREWVLPPCSVDEGEAAHLFMYSEEECIRVVTRLNALVEEKRELSYQTAWERDEVLGNALERCRSLRKGEKVSPLDLHPFRDMWEDFYRREIKTPELLLEVYLYQQCRSKRDHYKKNVDLYKKVFGSGLLKKPPFENLIQGLRYGVQARTVIEALCEEYIPDSLKARWGLCGTAKLLSVLDTSNDLFEVSEKRWNNEILTYTKRATELPVFSELIGWLYVPEADWNSAFVLRFRLLEYYEKQKSREKSQYYYGGVSEKYLHLADYVQCYVRGIWDKDLFYKAVFSFLSLGSLLGPSSIVEQKGAVPTRDARVGTLNAFFGYDTIKPTDGKYHFDTIGDELPAMGLAHTIYREVVPAVLKVELSRGEQPTPFSSYISQIAVIYGIPYMIQILTALGKDTLQRGYYYSGDGDRKSVLSHLLKVSMPEPEETAADLAAALKGSEITKKRLVELAMYAVQWIPMLEEYLKLPGLASGCYYFMAHTSERFDEYTTSVIAKYTPLSPDELQSGAFDINWFFEAYGKLGEKNFKLLYDAAKYSSTGIAHGRARKYADAALGRTDKETLKKEIGSKRNKDLLMSIGLLPLAADRKERDADLLDRYQFIQEYKKESRKFGAQRRASEGRAVEIALRNLSVNAGFTDVTRLILRMENRLVELSASYFEWQKTGEIELMISVDENGKSTLKCRRGEKVLKSVPAGYKKNEMVLLYQETNKKLKEQYSRTKQMMEQAMEDGTTFEVWEMLELQKNPVVRPIVEMLVVVLVEEGFDAARQRRGKEEDSGEVKSRCMGFLTGEGIVDWAGKITPVRPEDQILIAHPFDLYRGDWHEYQKLLFEKQIRQPFKQVFRELYVKLAEEMGQKKSLLFSGNQIQPQKTAGALRGRRWVADYDDGLQKVYYRENIVARIYAMADWFTPSDVEAPTLDWVVFYDRKTGEALPIRDVPDIIYSEVMRDVDLAVSVAHAGGVDPETSHSTIEMRSAIVACNLSLFKVKNVRLDKNHAIIDGKLGQYTVHLGSGVVHQIGNAMLFVIPVHSQHRGRMFLPFIDDDPKTAEILSKILLFAEDTKIKDPNILSQIR